MSLETATFIDQLDANNPTTTDPKSQGDDHFRLLKAVLKSSIKRVTRAFYVPGTVTKTSNYSVVASDDNMTIVCDTTTAFTLTLPSLVAADAGWCVYVQKASIDSNPVWIAPPSGAINGFAKVRRSIPFVITKVLWTGSTWAATRPAGVPVGSVIDFHGGSLPQGHLWADGRTYSSADFVELFAALGSTTKPDYRGRVGAGNDNPGSLGAAGRIGTVVTDSGTINGSATGSAGGSSTHALVTAEIPSHQHTGTTSSNGAHTHNIGDNVTGGAGGPTSAANSNSNTGFTTTSNGAHTHTFTTDAAGGGGAHAILQPTIISFKILVAE